MEKINIRENAKTIFLKIKMFNMNNNLTLIHSFEMCLGILHSLFRPEHD